MLRTGIATIAIIALGTLFYVTSSMEPHREVASVPKGPTQVYKPVIHKKTLTQNN